MMEWRLINNWFVVEFHLNDLLPLLSPNFPYSDLAFEIVFLPVFLFWKYILTRGNIAIAAFLEHWQE